jgi:stage V sporulation protein B
MLPTALTEICEQFVKVAVGILFAYLFRNNWQIAVAYTLLAVTLSEAFTAALALVFYAERPRLLTPLFSQTEVSAHDVLAYTIPLTITALAAPLCQLAESVVFSRLLRAQGQDATALWGVFSGCAITLINLPVSVTYGLAAASVPQITPLVERGEGQRVGKTVWKTYAITLAVSVPAALALYVFAPLLAGLFFRSLALEQKDLLVQLVRVMAVNAVTSSLVQTSSACLTAMGKPYYSTLSQWVSSLLRVGITALCIGVFQLGAIGAAVASNSCYLVAFLLNFWYSIRVINRLKRSARDDENHTNRLGRGQRRLNYQGEKGA